MQTVLMVDDSKIFQMLLTKLLSPHFMIAGKGNSGIEGLELYDKLRPDLVLMDITMPNCSGKECLQKIMKLDPNAKVIMVSSLSDIETAKECLQLGAKAFINKDQITSNVDLNSELIKVAMQVAGLATQQAAA